MPDRRDQVRGPYSRNRWPAWNVPPGPRRQRLHVAGRDRPYSANRPVRQA